MYDEDISGSVCDVLAAQGKRLVEALGSRLAGVDVLTNDPKLSLDDAHGAFIEINTTPGLHHHYVCEREFETHTVARRILASLLSP